MDRNEIFEFVKQEYGVEPDYPWNDGNAVLRHKKDRKWFALIMEVSRCKIGLPGDETTDIVNVKCDPMMISMLSGQEGYHPAYHMNKENWLTIRLDGSVEGATIKNLIRESFALTSPKKRDEKS